MATTQEIEALISADNLTGKTQAQIELQDDNITSSDQDAPMDLDTPPPHTAPRPQSPGQTSSNSTSINSDAQSIAQRKSLEQYHPKNFDYSIPPYHTWSTPKSIDLKSTKSLSHYTLPVSHWPAYRAFYHSYLTHQTTNIPSSTPQSLSKTYPSATAPFHEQVREYVLKWAVWGTTIPDPERRVEVLKWVMKRMSEAWKTAINEGVATLAQGDGPAAEKARKRLAEGGGEKAKKRHKPDPDDAWIYSDGLYESRLKGKTLVDRNKKTRVLKTELEAAGVNPEIVARRVSDGEIAGGEKLLDRTVMKLRRDIQMSDWWCQFQRTNLLMYALHEVQYCRDEMIYFERLRRGFKTQHQRSNTMWRIDESRSRKDNFMALALILHEKKKEAGDESEEDVEMAEEAEKEGDHINILSSESDQDPRISLRPRRAAIGAHSHLAQASVELSDGILSPVSSEKPAPQPALKGDEPDHEHRQQEFSPAAPQAPFLPTPQLQLPPFKQFAAKMSPQLKTDSQSDGRPIPQLRQASQHLPHHDRSLWKPGYKDQLSGYWGAARLDVQQLPGPLPEKNQLDPRLQLQPQPQQSEAGPEEKSKIITLKLRAPENRKFNPAENIMYDQSIRKYKGFTWQFLPQSLLRERETMHDVVRDEIIAPIFRKGTSAAKKEACSNGAYFQWRLAGSDKVIAHGVWDVKVGTKVDKERKGEMFFKGAYSFDEHGDVVWHLDQLTAEADDDLGQVDGGEEQQVAPKRLKTTKTKKPTRKAGKKKGRVVRDDDDGDSGSDYKPGED